MGIVLLNRMNPQLLCCGIKFGSVRVLFKQAIVCVACVEGMETCPVQVQSAGRTYIDLDDLAPKGPRAVEALSMFLVYILLVCFIRAAICSWVYP